MITYQEIKDMRRDFICKVEVMFYPDQEGWGEYVLTSEFPDKKYLHLMIKALCHQDAAERFCHDILYTYDIRHRFRDGSVIRVTDNGDLRTLTYVLNLTTPNQIEEDSLGVVVSMVKSLILSPSPPWSDTE